MEKNFNGTRTGSYTSQSKKAEIIKELREEEYKLSYLLKAMDLAKSTYYFKISKEDIITKRNEEVLNQIIDIFKTNKELYSVRRFHHELINCGYSINHKRVQKLMHKAGLFGK